MDRMTTDSASSPSRTPQRNFGRVFLILGIAAVILCGVALLPKPARFIALVVAVPIAAVTLPSMLFNAASLRCPACHKALPLAFEGASCPSCNAPLDLKTPKPSDRA